MASHLWVFFLEAAGHWIAIVTGSAVSLFILIREKKNKKPIEWRTILVIFAAGLAISLFFSWQDEYTSAKWRGGEIQRLTAVTAAQTIQIGELDHTISDKDALLEKTVGTISATQQSLESLSNRIIDINKPTVEKHTFYIHEISTKRSSRIIQVIETTNKPIVPVNAVLTCNGTFSGADFQLARTDENEFQGPDRKLSASAEQFQIASPTWTELNPLVITIYSDDPALNACDVKLQ